MGTVLEHKCPSCGATVTFDIALQKVKCPYCDSEFEMEEFKDEDLKEIEINEELSNDAGSEWGTEDAGLSEYLCESCGGEIYSDENTSATMCPYCGNAVILKGRLSGVLKPDRVIPFKRSSEDAQETFKGFAKGKILAPKNFINDSKIEEIKGLYVPYWLYDAELFADMRYKAMYKSEYDAGDEVVIRRDYYSVVRKGNIAFDHVPVDGSAKLDDTMMESLEPFYYDESEDFQTAYLTGHLADKYDVDQDAARGRAIERMRNSTADTFRNTVTGYDTVETVEGTVSVTKSSSEYVLYPVWTLHTKWRDKDYLFAMNAQTGKMVGNIPVDKGKAVAWFIGLLLVFGAIGLGVGYGITKGWGSAIGIGLAFGLLVSALIVFFMVRALKTVRAQNSAAQYYRDGSFNLTQSGDYFLYSRTERRKKSS